MSTHLIGFQVFFSFLHYFVLAKLATSSMKFKFEVHSAAIQCLS